MKPSRTQKGFTLIELLVVIAIIGLLSSIILASLNTARNKGYDSVRQSNLIQIQSALDQYYDDHGKYPAANGSYTDGGSYGLSGQCSISNGPMAPSSVITGLVPTYIAAMPTDNQTVIATNVCCYQYFVSNSGADYKFAFSGCPTSASYAVVAGSNAKLADPIHNSMWSVYTPGARSF